MIPLGQQWDDSKACIQVFNGSLILQGCDFMRNSVTTEHIYLGKDVKSAVITGNRVRTEKLKMKNESEGHIEVFGHIVF